MLKFEKELVFEEKKLPRRLFYKKKNKEGLFSIKCDCDYKTNNVSKYEIKENVFFFKKYSYF